MLIKVTGAPDIREAVILLSVGLGAIITQAVALIWYAVSILATGETAIGAVALWAVAALIMVGSDKAFSSLMGQPPLRIRNARKRGAFVKNADWAMFGLITSWATFHLLSTIGDGNMWVSAVWALAIVAAATLFQQSWNIARWREPATP